MSYKIGIIGFNHAEVKASQIIANNICTNELRYSDLFYDTSMPQMIDPLKLRSVARTVKSNYFSGKDEGPKQVTQINVELGPSPYLTDADIITCAVEFANDAFACRSYIRAQNFEESMHFLDRVSEAEESAKNYIGCPVAESSFDPSSSSTWPSLTFITHRDNIIEAVEPFTPINKIEARLKELNR